MAQNLIYVPRRAPTTSRPVTRMRATIAARRMRLWSPTGKPRCSTSCCLLARYDLAEDMPCCQLCYALLYAKVAHRGAWSALVLPVRDTVRRSCRLRAHLNCTVVATIKRQYTLHAGPSRSWRRCRRPAPARTSSCGGSAQRQLAPASGRTCSRWCAPRTAFATLVFKPHPSRAESAPVNLKRQTADLFHPCISITVQCRIIVKCQRLYHNIDT